jgi:hypothetical protein
MTVMSPEEIIDITDQLKEQVDLQEKGRRYFITLKKKVYSEEKKLGDYNEVNCIQYT